MGTEVISSLSMVRTNRFSPSIPKLIGYIFFVLRTEFAERLGMSGRDKGFGVRGEYWN
jgi:hypothetical protein